MGFIGGYITPDFGITGEDRKNAYYVIDGIRFNSDITTTDDIVITIIFNIYPSVSDRISRINLLGSEEIKKNINRTEFTGDILEEYYPQSYLGDVNGDSLVNIQDVIIVINLILSEEFDLIADVNSDNVVDILDVVQLVNIILN